VRDGGRARVYVYSFSRAAETARDQSCTVTTPEDEAESAWASAEKKMLVVPRIDTISRGASVKVSSRVQCAAGTAHLFRRHVRHRDKRSDDVFAADRASAETRDHGWRYGRRA
jgi:hypothetical protein